MNRDEILARALRLLECYEWGELGGERMPEDANPGLRLDSRENALYFTLPMALNYQRSAYALWESAASTWGDEAARDVFFPECVVQMTEVTLREKLLLHKLALQPNRHPAIWRRLSQTFMEDFGGDVRQMFDECGYTVEGVREYFAQNKKRLPYLGGEKILNYWLYVMEQRGGVRFVDRERITVAPDTHVIQSSIQLGVISAEEANRSDVRAVTADRWSQLLTGTDRAPIDFHTPMWLWSRSGFHAEI